jgi:hypothetical protein
VIRRIIQRVLRRLIRGIVLRPIRAFFLLVVLLMGAGILFWQGVVADMPSLSLAMPGLPFRGISGAPVATESYLKGNETYNAELMWTALSEEALERFRSRGGTVQSLQQQMDQAKQAGAALERITYVGGESFPDGTSMHFYVVLARGPQSRGEAEYVSYVFTLDQSGKIARVQ